LREGEGSERVSESKRGERVRRRRGRVSDLKKK
jgi:hypothetical protein